MAITNSPPRQARPRRRQWRSQNICCDVKIRTEQFEHAFFPFDAKAPALLAEFLEPERLDELDLVFGDHFFLEPPIFTKPAFGAKLEK
jgi:hypothetical protein